MRLSSIFLMLCIFLPRQALSQQTKSDPFILGSTVILKSEILSENRPLNIYLPDDYSMDATRRYPVIYLLDGSADEDFIHVVGLVQYLSFPWINAVPKSIVVGIANTHRVRDFTSPVADLNFVTEMGFDTSRFADAGGSAWFMDFVEKELQPFIERQYRVSDRNTIIGQSLGGLFVTEILVRKPELFDTYLIVSPSLWWDNASLLEQAPQLLKEDSMYPCNVYIGVGKEGKDMIGYSRSLVKLLRKSLGDEARVFYDYLPDEDHATIAHRAIYRAFEFLK